MSKRVIISIILGTIILFVWNAVAWMVLPFHSSSLKEMPAASVNMMDEFRKSLPESGVYHYPGMPKNDSPEYLQKVEKTLENGRITAMVFKKEPTKLFEPSAFLGGLLLNFLTVLFTYLVVSRLQYKSLTPVLITCVLLGLICSVMTDFSLVNWFWYPLGYTMANVFDILVSFGLLGVLFGAYTFKSKDVA